MTWLHQHILPHESLVGPSPVPTRFQSVTLAGLDEEKINKAVRSYGKHFWSLAPEGRGVLFTGPPGRYKTYGAAVLAQAIHHRFRIPVGWCTVPVDLTHLERNRFSSDTEERLENWKSCPWLVMDDFAIPPMGTWQHSVVLEIGMYRHANQLPTCWTGNLTTLGRSAQEVLSGAVGAQLARRIGEASRGYRVMF